MISRTLVLTIDSDRVEVRVVSSYLRGQNFESTEAAEGLSGLREFFNVHPVSSSWTSACMRCRFET
jgi:hypothetical protein